MLYLSMVLIGRRHLRAGQGMPVHYIVRAVSLGLIALGVNAFFVRHDFRADVTSERLSSLAPDTVKLLQDLKPSRPIVVEAFVSPTVPDAYVQTRLNLVSILREMAARAGGEIDLRINDTQAYSEQALRARDRYGITPREVRSDTRGALSQESIFLGVAVTCGLQKTVVPFVDRGTPVEYELARSLVAATQPKKKRMGVLQTNAHLFGTFDMQTMSSMPNWPIVEELQKLYDVVQVDATQPITEKYDVLLAVQPSSLTPEQFTNFAAAVTGGQPTAIFEDPMPAFCPAPGTLDPKRPPAGMNPMMMQQQPPPQKASTDQLKRFFESLGVDFSGLRSGGGGFDEEMPFGGARGDCDVVWQKYNAIPKLADLNEKMPEFVFIDHAVAKEPFDETSPISSKLQLLFFPFPGYISKLNSFPKTLEFVPLVKTGDKATGTEPYSEASKLRRSRQDSQNRRRSFQGVEYTLAAQIRGTLPTPASEPKPDAKDTKEKPKSAEINVVLVADLDVLSEMFFRFRDQPELTEGLKLPEFDNVAFVLNIMDDLAKDPRFMDIRKRRHVHRTLSKIDELTEESRRATAKSVDELLKGVENVSKEGKKDLENKKVELRKQLEKENVNRAALDEQLDIFVRDLQKQMETKLEQEQQTMKQKVEQIQTSENLKIRHVQDRYKMYAVLLPPLPPLFLAIGVFFVRRWREREGVSRSRFRS